MDRKKFWMVDCLGLICISAGLILWAASPRNVQAQCGDYPPDSSCITCHEKDYPVFDQGEWHILHGRKDCCAQCHGGNCSTREKNLAHVGMVANPLEDIYTNCHHCHPDDYQARAEKFALALGVTPGSRPTPTRAVLAASVKHQLLVMPQPALTVGPSWSGLGAFLGVISLAILALGIELRYLLSHT
jgi:hypothetical protein